MKSAKIKTIGFVASKKDYQGIEKRLEDFQTYRGRLGHETTDRALKNFWHYRRVNLKLFKVTVLIEEIRMPKRKRKSK